MRHLVFLFLLSLAAPLLAAPAPAELEVALKDFRTEGTKGWAFTQTTVSDGRTLVEHFDPAKPDFQRWTLVKKDGRAPTAEEAKEYSQMQTRRTGGANAPNVKDQVAPDSCELISETPTEAVYRFRLKPGGDDDKSAASMHTQFTLHRPTRTISRVELSNFEPFSPVLAVKVKEARTVMTYSLPEGDRPTLLQDVTLHIRGTAMFFKSLDQDMTVTYTDHAYAGKK